MASYFVDKYPGGDGNHLIHAAGCAKVKSTAGKIYLGKYEHCSSAKIAAQKHYPKINGCPVCSQDCHKRERE